MLSSINFKERKFIIMVTDIIYAVLACFAVIFAIFLLYCIYQVLKFVFQFVYGFVIEIKRDIRKARNAINPKQDQKNIIDVSSVAKSDNNDKLLIVVDDCSRQPFFEKLNSTIMDIKLYEDFFVILMETDLLIMDYAYEESRNIPLHDLVTNYNFSET